MSKSELKRICIQSGCAVKEGMDRIRSEVDEQAEDEGLWFDARTAPEAYLQMKLRELHAVIEY